MKGLIDALDIDEFNAKLADLYTKWDCKEKLSSFKRYLQRYKEDNLRYHTMAGAVKAAEICSNPGKLYNKNHESINKLIKHWQNFKRMDLYEFIKQYEDLTECQGSDIQRDFLGLNSPYIVRNEFQHMVRSFNPVGKQRLEDEFHNVIVDENSHKNITGFKAGMLTIASPRQNAKRLLLSTTAGEESVASTDLASFQQQLPYTVPMQASVVDINNIQFPDLDSLVFLLQDALLNKRKDVVMAMVLKSKEIIASNFLLKGFPPGQYLVK